MARLRNNKVGMLVGLALLALLITIGMGARGALAGAPLGTATGSKAALGASGKAASSGRTSARTAKIDPASVTNPNEQAVNSQISMIPIQDQEIDLGKLSIHPTDRPIKLMTPDGNAVGTQNAFMSVSPEVVSQTTTDAIATLGANFTPSENVQYYINGALATTVPADTSGRVAVRISTGPGFGYITFQMVGVTSGKVAGGVAQVLDAAPPVPGLAIAPHAINHGGTIYMYGVRWQTGTTISLARDGTSLGTTSTATGRFLLSITTPVTPTEASVIYTAMTATNLSLVGQSEEERADAGTPPQGDLNLARAYVDRPVLPTAGGVIVFSGEGFLPNETVNLGTCTSPLPALADANGAIAWYLDFTGAPAGVYHCSYTGSTSGRVARGTIQVNANARNAPTGINSPATLPSGAADFAFLFDRLLPNQGGNILIDGAVVMTSTTDADGVGGEILPAPTTQGIHEVAFIGNSGEVAIAPLFIGPPAVTSPTPTGTPPTSTPTRTSSPTSTNTATRTPTVTPTCPPVFRIFGPGNPGQVGKAVAPAGAANSLSSSGRTKSIQTGNSLRDNAPIDFILDDGSYENSIGFGTATTETASIWLNRYTPPVAAFPVTINNISIAWPDQGARGPIIGLQPRLLVYGDADGDGNPANATLLFSQTVTVNITDTFQVYPVSVSVPGPTGDIYIGFEDAWAESGYTPKLFPAAIDQDPPSQVRSWIVAMASGAPPDLSNLGNNDTRGTIDSFGLAGNWLIRANGVSSLPDPCQATSTPTASPTLTPTPGLTLIGHVTYQGIAQPSARNVQAITLTLCIGGTPQNFVQNTDNQGFFTVTLGIGPGNYNYSVKSYKNLAKAGTTALTSGTNNVELGTLNTGDTNNSNNINTADFNLLRNNFGTSSNPFTDLNNDGITNTTDFNLLRNNFGTAGQTLTCP